MLAAARNQVLSRLLENVYAQILVLRLRSLYLPERVESSVAEHRELFEAVVAGRGGPGEGPAPAPAHPPLPDAPQLTPPARRESLTRRPPARRPSRPPAPPAPR